MSATFSISEENYLKAIYHLQTEHEVVSTNALAAYLNARPASITDMMKKLSNKKLLHYKKYYGFSLSAEGKKVAIGIIRRHRLWEFFLSEKLKFNWNEVHYLAEELEHVSNKQLIDKLDAYLGYPPFDPHGDPIPDSKGKIAPRDLVNLSAIPFHEPAPIVYVSGQSKQLLDELEEKNIQIGTVVEIKKRSVFDGSFTVRIRNKNIVITEQIAQHLFVKQK